ncbi:hypothetical protein CWI37_0099p0030 [Hamiltosporidium tvaerminnensis]|uniref:Uncharacterized protein n=1 Tax=Hamiltosporidium tvaerminnensis TaxID=1176355 RepID=A0A4Q9LA88_9MICR|nr:hypothetical protein CWI37_0099p0030 [Hamiltosporidium tvaerminnensis]
MVNMNLVDLKVEINEMEKQLNKNARKIKNNTKAILQRELVDYYTSESIKYKELITRLKIFVSQIEKTKLKKNLNNLITNIRLKKYDEIYKKLEEFEIELKMMDGIVPDEESDIDLFDDILKDIITKRYLVAIDKFMNICLENGYELFSTDLIEKCKNEQCLMCKSRLKYIGMLSITGDDIKDIEYILI